MQHDHADSSARYLTRAVEASLLGLEPGQTRTVDILPEDAFGPYQRSLVHEVPRAAFAWVTERLKGKVGIPLVATNRINTPEVAEEVLANGQADMVSMARPFLADPEFVNKAAAGRDRKSVV